MQDYHKAVDFIYNLAHGQWKFGLERIVSALSSLGNPQDSYPSIHVAGTNGKGSVCAMLYSILNCAGYKSGLYTSPHLIDIVERFQIAGKQMQRKEFVSLVNEFRHLSGELTFFEYSTLLAFEYFRQKKVDVAVIETGLGGRLDATNVVKPKLSIITSIDYDHTNILGSTLQSIAREKAGIIKPSVPVIAGCQGIAFNEVKGAAKRLGSRLIKPSANVIQLDSFIDSQVIRYKDMKIDFPLAGDYQLENIKIVLQAVHELNCMGYNISDKAIAGGLKNTKWPARLQLVSKNPLFIIDGSHNVAGIRVTLDFIRRHHAGRIVAVVSMMKDKQCEQAMHLIDEAADFVVLTKARIERAAEPSELAGFLEKPHLVRPDVSLAVKASFSRAKKSDMVLVIGSLYLAGNVLESV